MPELHLQRSGSTLNVILGERRLSFPLIDVALNATYAGYLGHPFTKSETCAGTISLVSHLVFTKRCMEQENREEAHPCFLNMDTPLPATRQRVGTFSLSAERKQGREDLNT